MFKKLVFIDILLIMSSDYLQGMDTQNQKIINQFLKGFVKKTEHNERILDNEFYTAKTRAHVQFLIDAGADVNVSYTGVSVGGKKRHRLMFQQSMLDLPLGEGASIVMVNEEGDSLLQEYKKIFVLLINYTWSETFKENHRKKIENIEMLFENARKVDDLMYSDQKALTKMLVKFGSSEYSYLVKRVLCSLNSPEKLRIFEQNLLHEIRGSKDYFSSVEEFEKWLLKNYASKNILFQLMVKGALPITRTRFLEQTRLRQSKLLSYQRGATMLQEDENGEVAFGNVKFAFKQ